MVKKLKRKMNGKMIAGVCNGLADYFNIDVTLLRLIAAILVVCGGSGVIAYLVAWVIIPSDGYGNF